jgi:hypothetical protein
MGTVCNRFQGWKYFLGPFSLGRALLPSATQGYFLKPLRGIGFEAGNMMW